MKVFFLFPPNFREINKAFDVRGKPVIFAYGSIIYNPTRMFIPARLFAHEAVHCDQQGSDPAGWWSRYIADPAFRLEQEIPAHCAEMRHWQDRAEGYIAEDRLEAIAGRLASSLYGNLMTFVAAKQLLSEHAGVARNTLSVP